MDRLGLTVPSALANVLFPRIIRSYTGFLFQIKRAPSGIIHTSVFSHFSLFIYYAYRSYLSRNPIL